MPANVPTITSSSDIYDVELLNKVIKVVLNRALAAGYNFDTFFTPHRPSATPRELEEGDHVAIAPTEHTGFLRPNNWQFSRISDMQLILQGCVSSYMKDEEYPDRWLGVDQFDPDAEPVWSWDSMSDAIGHPDDITGIVVTNRLWRRMRPRRIHTLTGTTRSIDHAYQSITLGLCEVGDLAAYYASGTSYRGVYQYQGSGTWTPAPEGAKPDMMDSNAPYQSRLWIYPTGYVENDYYGWHLLENICDVCRRMNVGSYYVEPYHDGVNGKYQHKQATTQDTPDPDETSTGDGAACIAAMHAATPTTQTWNVGGWPGCETMQVHWDDYGEGYPRDNYEVSSDTFNMGLKYYRGIGGTLEYFGQAIAPFGVGAVFHPQGTSLSNTGYTLISSHTLDGVHDDWTVRNDEAWSGHLSPTTFVPTAWSGTRYGFRLPYVQAAITWNFPD